MINPELDWQKIQADIQQGPFFASVVDDFLQPEILAQYCEFLEHAEGWQTLDWGEEWQALAHGYQHNLQPKLPNFKKLIAQLSHHLNLSMWQLVGHFAVKCLKNRGFLPHADNAALIVNLWVTPDKYNLLPGKSGMQFWDVQRPANMPYEMFTNANYVTQYLKAHSSDVLLNVPYKQNRAIIFDGRTFHQSQPIKFIQSSRRSMRTSLTLAFDRPYALTQRTIKQLL